MLDESVAEVHRPGLVGIAAWARTAAGAWAFAMGLAMIRGLAADAESAAPWKFVLFICVLSLSDAINPPTWVRIVRLAWLPIGFVGTPISYALARLGPGRGRGRIGIAITLIGLLAFVVLLFAAG